MIRGESFGACYNWSMIGGKSFLDPVIVDQWLAKKLLKFFIYIKDWRHNLWVLAITGQWLKAYLLEFFIVD